MARVLALMPDLLFGSRVQGVLSAAGHEVELVTSADALTERLQESQAPDAVVVDLASGELDGVTLIESMSAEGRLKGVRTLGFYSHTDTATRERAEGAGVDLVVPRSRMVREGPQLIARLAPDDEDRRREPG